MGLIMDLMQSAPRSFYGPASGKFTVLSTRPAEPQNVPDQTWKPRAPEPFTGRINFVCMPKLSEQPCCAPNLCAKLPPFFPL